MEETDACVDRLLEVRDLYRGSDSAPKPHELGRGTVHENRRRSIELAT